MKAKPSKIVSSTLWTTDWPLITLTSLLFPFIVQRGTLCDFPLCNKQQKSSISKPAVTQHSKPEYQPKPHSVQIFLNPHTFIRSSPMLIGRVEWGKDCGLVIARCSKVTSEDLWSGEGVNTPYASVIDPKNLANTTCSTPISVSYSIHELKACVSSENGQITLEIEKCKSIF